jgi:hypothetical protein
MESTPLLPLISLNWPIGKQQKAAEVYCKIKIISAIISSSEDDIPTLANMILAHFQN